MVHPDIGIVIAGDDGDIIRVSQGGQPVARGGKLGRQADVHKVPRHRNMVRALLGQVGAQPGERLARMDFLAPAMPVHIAEDALAEEMLKPWARQRGEVNVREVRKGEHGCHMG
ncbi:MAG: hypothetical protein Kow0032_27860 [Methyloligellaceae bacterium]